MYSRGHREGLPCSVGTVLHTDEMMKFQTIESSEAPRQMAAPLQRVAKGARRLSEPAMQGISRDERPANPPDAGWRVRLFKDGKYVANRHFRDAAYGGKPGSLYAAQRYRDDMAVEFGVRRRVGEVTALAGHRVSAGLSQSTVASWLHVSTPLVTRWEHEGAPEPVLRLATAMFDGAVKPQKTVPTPDLASLRQKLGLRQEDMARKFDRRLAAYGEWERGKRQMPGWVAVYVQAVASGWDESGGAMLAGEEQPMPTAAPICESAGNQVN